MSSLSLSAKATLITFLEKARDAGVADCVHFEGLQPNSRVIEAMRSSDLVVVPSHHLYPEGLPCVFYEAIATGTPVICSNHPMFGASSASRLRCSFPRSARTPMQTPWKSPRRSRALSTDVGGHQGGMAAVPMPCSLG